MTFFQIYKSAVFLEFSENSLNGFFVILASIFNINQYIIRVHNDKNVKFLSRDLVDIVLKAGIDMKKIEKYNLVLKIAVSHLESYFPLVILLNSHLII